MVTAWQIPLDPTKDASLTDTRMAEQVRWGYRIFTDTPREAARFTGGKVSCSNCHLNAGQRERALALVGVAGMFPEYNNRAARLISLPDRIVDCFLRSENGTARPRTSFRRRRRKKCWRSPRTSPGCAKGYAVGAEPGVAQQEHDCRRRADPDRQTGSRQGRGDLRGALHVVPRRGRTGRADRRQESRTAVGRSLVERRRRRGARLHAGRHHSLHDAVSRSRAA